MGNSQGSSARSAITITPIDEKLTSSISLANADLGLRGSRRGSRTKVFGRFGQKKTQQQILPITSSTSTLTFNTFEHNISEEEPAVVIDNEQLQRHDTLLRQLEEQQIGIRNNLKKPSIKKRRYFCKRNENDDEQEPTVKEQKKFVKTTTRQKRQAPKPPGQAIQQFKSINDSANIQLSDDVATIQIESTVTKAAKSIDTNQTKPKPSDHCEFIESLFAATTAACGTKRIIDDASDYGDNDNEHDNEDDVSCSVIHRTDDSDKPTLQALTTTTTDAAVADMLMHNRKSEAKQNLKNTNIFKWNTENRKITTDVLDTIPLCVENLSSLDVEKLSKINNESIEPESGGVMHDSSIDPITPQTSSLPSDVDEIGEQVTHLPVKYPRLRLKSQRDNRPLSEISVTSAETSALLSPITQKAIFELQQRHKADKLTQLSLSKTVFLEIPPDAALTPAEDNTTSSEPIENEESADEHMALQLSKKLAQVLGNNAGSGNTNIVAPVEAPTAASMLSPSNEMFNISKAKKIELQNLSSRLTPTTALTPTTTAAEASNASTDTKPLPHTAETQSTVIISFKSSQTPAQSQQSNALTNAETTSSSAPAINTSIVDSSVTGANINVLESAASSFISTTGAETPATATTPVSHYPCTTPTATGSSSNVLRKVASFTAEKVSASATPGGAVNGNGSGMGSAAHMESITRRLSYVPEKLSFDAYEKFEGQMLMKWLMSSFQVTTSNLNEQDISSITLQYCSSLLRVGVLKPISDKSDVENFRPFQMYQWTYTEAPTTSIPITPGRLDKTNTWLYCSSTPAGPTKIPKPLSQLASNKTPNTRVAQKLTQELRERVLSCATIEEVYEVIRDTIFAERRNSKRCIQLAEALDASETTIYEYAPVDVEASSATPPPPAAAAVTTASTKDLKNAQTETEAVDGVCQLCGMKRASKDTKIVQTTPVPVNEIGVQTDVIVGDGAHIAKNEAPRGGAPPPPPPPLPPPPPPFPVGDMPFAPQIPDKIPKPPPLPPPAPPFPTSLTTPPPAPAASSSTAPPPPPPSAGLLLNVNLSGSQSPNSKQPATSSPAPLPNPAECNWFNKVHTLRKAAVNPPKPMKPLYWTRIVTPVAPPPLPTQSSAPNVPAIIAGDVTDSNASSPDELGTNSPPPPVTTPPKEIWQEIEETRLDNIDEFTELFSRRAVVPVSKPKETKEIRTKTIKKVLDSKRSQNVGIVSRSLHVDFCEIEHAIYHVDTSVVSLETLQQIINVKATHEELEQIKKAACETDGPLDYPEQFLLKISQISMSTERISCIVFQAEFEEAATLISRKLEIIAHLSQFLIESEDLKLVFSIILTLGNYMNGGNRQRGQADGFTLEILGKLKDVKSTRSNITLLHFIVRTYIAHRRKEGQQLNEMVLPTPEPADVERAVQVDFDEVKQQISEMKRKLNACKKTAEKVIAASTEDTLQPFKSKMEEFIESATKTVDKLYKELEECRELFVETMRFYHFMPKSCTHEQCTPDQFFEYWTSFSNDFKDIWKKEIAMLWEELAKKSRQARTKTVTNTAVKAAKAKPGGLKERIMRLSKK